MDILFNYVSFQYRQAVSLSSQSIRHQRSFSAFGFGAGGSTIGSQASRRGSSQINVNVTPTQTTTEAVGDTPEIRKYKKKFTSDILCAALWGKIQILFCIILRNLFKSQTNHTFLDFKMLFSGKLQFRKGNFRYYLLRQHPKSNKYKKKKPSRYGIDCVFIPHYNFISFLQVWYMLSIPTTMITSFWSSLSFKLFTVNLNFQLIIFNHLTTQIMTVNIMVYVFYCRCEPVNWYRSWFNVAGQKWSRKR